MDLCYKCLLSYNSFTDNKTNVRQNGHARLPAIYSIFLWMPLQFKVLAEVRIYPLFVLLRVQDQRLSALPFRLSLATYYLTASICGIR